MLQASRDTSPDSRSERATRPVSPAIMAARRMRSAATPEAFANASNMRPSMAPWRSPPSSNSFRNFCSSSVASAIRDSSCARFCRSDPRPFASPSEVNALSTSRTSRVADCAGVACESRTAAKPMPVRPCRVAPDKKETTISISSQLSCFKRSASSSILASRFEVAATRAEVSTTLASSMTALQAQFRLFLQIQQIALLADVHRRGLAPFFLRAGGLMNVPAEKISRLLPLQELPHRPAPGMAQIRDPVEHRPQRRDVANRNHRLQPVELVQPLFQLLLRIFTGRLERRWIRVAETNHVEAADLDPPPVKVMQPEAAAQIRNLLRRFVIAGDRVHPDR